MVNNLKSLYQNLKSSLILFAFKKLGFDLTLILLYLDMSLSGLIEMEVKVEAVQLL